MVCKTFLVLVALLNVSFGFQLTPIVRTKYGKISGFIKLTENGQEYYAYEGIPYASSPVGPLRFRIPELPKSWIGIRNCSREGPNCIQSSFLDPFLGDKSDEDCLFLNIYVPKDSWIAKDKAVMVYIHGGGFNTGSGDFKLYGPAKLMNYDVIVVTINYRLGMFGFLSTGDSILPGNYGLWDQVRALNFVQENIEFFGGNKKNVLIFGESAGGASVSLHLLSNASQGLFSKAIMQSGVVTSPWAMTEDPLQSARQVARRLNCSIESSREIRECMKVKTTKELFDAYSDYAIFPEIMPFYFAPVVEKTGDGQPHFLVDHPKNILDRHAFTNVPTIIGFNSQEGASLTTRVRDRYKFDRNFFDSLEFVDYVRRITHLEENLSEIVAILKRQYFANVSDFDDKNQTMVPLKELTGDALCKFASIKFANTLVQQNQDVFFYVFSYRGKRSTVNPEDGPAHMDELQYLFDSILFGVKTDGEDDLETQRRMLEMWTNFAKTGYPTLNGKDEIIWKPVIKEVFQYLDIGNKLEMRKNYNCEKMNLWDNILPTLARIHIAKSEL